MANEWTKVELYGANNDGQPRRYTCASGVAISKGTLCALTDARTVTAHASNNQMIAGIAAMDKSASDLSTSISVWTNGVFEATASDAILVGQAIIGSAVANKITRALPAASGAVIIGTALETATAAEAINVRVNL